MEYHGILPSTLRDIVCTNMIFWLDVRGKRKASRVSKLKMVHPLMNINVLSNLTSLV